MLRIGDWGEWAYIYVYRRGLTSRLLDQSASHPGRYHERKKETGSHQQQKPPINGSDSSKPPQGSSSKRPYNRNNKKEKIFQASKDKPHVALLNKDNKSIGDVDLLPLSVHASLEEQWTEEEEPEEIETVLKVVPPAYHQYFDVFSKLKEEKLPPHGASDHHIELEGLLPPEALSQFQIIKEEFTTSTILSHLKPSLPTIVETDASDYALASVLSHVNDSGKHPSAFDSHKLLPAELKYELNDKEQLGIVWALNCLRDFLLSLSHYFEFLKDHSSLQYFISSKLLTCFQARWADFLSKVHFTISYCPAKIATLPDALSCQENMYPERQVDFIRKNPQTFHQVLKKNEIQESIFFSINVEMSSDVVYQILKEV
ncbi:hypothetical protein O181_044076 [Austropuccinia psidii MF-1]|uniref:Reverse transcriptase RNase H-like domain-containing protein n=1 Tax=Austropuccinia psidii MF-1 TaxID=1389203 RepID=A0A9Q3DHU5_9BASI|nr:hypothetical protein [Austropuccinia psidii MF-1]